MTHSDKATALAIIKTRMETAARSNLPATARSWRELYVTVANRVPDEIIFSNKHDATVTDDPLKFSPLS